jgi:hypothetical protein
LDGTAGFGAVVVDRAAHGSAQCSAQCSATAVSQHAQMRRSAFIVANELAEKIAPGEQER